MSPEMANTSSNSCSVATTKSNCSASGLDPDLGLDPKELALASGPDSAPGVLSSAFKR